jgi:hypothetical protein
MNGNPPVPPAPPMPPTAPPVAGQPGASGKAIASLILGIASLPFICCWTCSFFGIILGTIGLILGRSEEKAIDQGKSPQAGRNMARAGWICGLIGVILCTLFLILTVVVWGFNWKNFDFTKFPQKTF